MKKRARELQLAVIKQMLVLATGGFGLVAALAWNDLIKGFIETNVKPYIAKDSGILAQLVYVFIITVAAVLVTIYLGGLVSKLESTNEEKKKA